MDSIAPPLPRRVLRCHYRPLLLGATAVVLLSVFWFASRYPQLLGKARHVGQGLPSMAFAGELIKLDVGAPAWRRILATAVNWLDGMRVGMAFGVLLGALLHTVLRYYPMKIGENLYLNSLKGALVGVPMGVCANCAVPTACGITRGHGRIEVALGFLFSSPNFNPVVVMMTLTALPWTMGVAKYGILLLIILVVVPGILSWLERSRPLPAATVGEDGGACPIPLVEIECTEPFAMVFRELAGDFAGNVWMLVKPTITIMLLASLLSAAMLVLVPWQSLLAEPSFGKMGLVSLISTLMPVPIALDVMFAAELQQQGVAPGYVMIFAMTLGSWSLIPSIYLWRDVSRRLAVILFGLFVALGWILGLVF